ncbi:MAG TPA: deoxyribose-phosphate aldolase [Stellaceae bacterium]|jgi:deoxyribose-phosphate aldolase
MTSHSPWRQREQGSATGAAQRVLPLIDLTNLDPQAGEADIRALCARAVTPFGPVAAVCVYPRFVPLAKALLLDRAGTHVQVATVCNFPGGAADPDGAARETEEAVAAGADEIDVVLPYEAFLAGDRATAAALIAACRRACRGTTRDERPAALLKVILETGRLGDAATVRAAADLAIDAGADFVKTSTGFVQPGATLPAATAILDAIAARRMQRMWAGIKVSGGIRSVADAMPYVLAAETKLGAGFVGPATFRIGASKLLDGVLAELGLPPS